MSQLVKDHIKKWPKSALNSFGKFEQKTFVTFNNDYLQIPIYEDSLRVGWEDENKIPETIKFETKTFQKYSVNASSIIEAILRVESDSYEVLNSNYEQKLVGVIDELSDNPEEIYAYTLYLRKWSEKELANFRLEGICD
jgi:hypothetical protein